MTLVEKKLLQKNGMEDSAREACIVQKIRRRYSLSHELALLRQREEKPEEFAAYHAYVEACKAEADAEREETL